jgi:transposase InsO family protein
MSKMKKTAEFRFAVIAGLLASPPEPGELRDRVDELAAKKWEHPARPGQPIVLSRRTIERWYYRAKNADSPVEALFAQPRAPQSKAILPAMTAELERSYYEFPHWTTQLHYDNFKVWLAMARANGESGPGELPSYATVRRLFRRAGWRRRKRLEQKEIRSYENPYVCGLWHLDFHHGRRLVIAPSGKKVVPICLCVLDDHARLCCHIQWFLHEDTRVLVHGFMQALLKRGLPRAVMSDNGSAMISAEFTQGLSRLGIKHELTLPYSPHQNGKQESFWGSVEGRLMSLLDAEPNLSLEKLNQATTAWAEMEYNNRPHSGVKMTPLERWTVGKSVARPAPTADSIRRAFRREVVRRVRHSDGTFTVDGVRFEVPSQYRALESVTVHYAQWDLSLIDLVDPKTKTVIAPIYPVDLERNAAGHRPVLPVSTPTSEAPPKAPRLLEKYIEDYAASGSPTPYIPLEEET